MVGASKTRKSKQGIMTIPALRKAFEHIETATQDLVSHSSLSTAQKVEHFQKLWKKTFYRDIDKKAAEAYLQVMVKSGKKKSKTRRFRGGSQPLAGAPLDYTTRPGIYGAYGVFPAYVDSGFRFYNDINNDSLTLQCGKENITPKIPADMGSNKVSQSGGSKRRRRSTQRKSRKGRKSSKKTMKGGAAVTLNPLPLSTPTTLINDMQSAWNAQKLPASPAAATATPPYIDGSRVVVAPTVYTHERALHVESQPR